MKNGLDEVKEVAPGVVRASYWHTLPNGTPQTNSAPTNTLPTNRAPTNRAPTNRAPTNRAQCDLCPRGCKLKPGQRGFCFVRENRCGEIVMTSYGRASGFCVDPIEKKPLNHFLPGTSVLSFGTSGCNLGCRFCQNWHLSHASKANRTTEKASPDRIAQAAADTGCKSVSFTYNEPIIFAEFAIDTANACHERGIKTVAVTAGYISPEARRAFFGVMDAANVDLKAFSERFYRKFCFAHLKPVLDTLVWIRRESTTWLEVTTLLIPGENDDSDEVRQLAAWCANNLGTETPLHFTAFRPAFRHTDSRATDISTLDRARTIAMEQGMKHVYTGNVRDASGQSTYCAGCDALIVDRSGYDIGAYRIDPDGKCANCGRKVAGIFGSGPDGRRVQPQRIRIH